MKRRRRLVIMIAAIVVAIVVVSVAVILTLFSAPPLQGSVSTISYASFLSSNVPPAGVTVVNSTNSIYVNQSGATIFIVATPPWANRSGEFFMCYGLVNPTFYLRTGMMERLALINADNESHNLLISSASPPYPYNPMGYGGMGMMWQSQYRWMYGSQMIGGINGTMHMYSYMNMVTMQVSVQNAGTYWYFDGYPGHAASGMFGQVEII